ncbi:hypothetical protein TKK_0009173 [Trichogramma kaykai]
MESSKDEIRVKKEPNDTWSDEGNDHFFDLVDSCETKDIETFPFYKLSVTNRMNEIIVLQEKSDEKLFVDFECKDVKPEPTFPLITNCKSEYQNCQSVVKIEKQNQTNNQNENISIVFECKDFKPELKILTTNFCTSDFQIPQFIVKKESESQPVQDDDAEASQQQQHQQPNYITYTLCAMGSKRS